MISIDETIDEPNWLRYTERVADFSRLIRFDAGGLGLSDPLPTGTGIPPLKAGAATRWPSWTQPDVTASSSWPRPAAPCQPSGWRPRTPSASSPSSSSTGRPGWAAPRTTASAPLTRRWPPGRASRASVTEDGTPRDITIFAPSLAHRVGFREWWGRAARRGASPATAQAFNLVTFSADVRWCLPSVTCPTLVFARLDSYAQLSEHGRYLSEHIAGAPPGHHDRARHPPVGRRIRLHRRRDGGVRDRGARRPRRHAACSPPCSSPTSWTRPCAPPKRATANGAPFSTSSTSTSGGSWPATTALLVKNDGRRDSGPIRRTGTGRALRRGHGAGG